MRLSASQKFNAIAKGASKTIRWSMAIRKTTSLSDSLASGTWIDVSDYIEWKSLSDIEARIENSTGEFTAGSVQIIGKNISWWDANIFNATSSQYLEVKIDFSLTGALDTIHVFQGFIDKLGVIRSEVKNQISCTAYTPTELGSRIPAELVSAQPLKENADGSGHNGLILPRIDGLWVMDAKITSYVLKLGTHKIAYDYNDGQKRARLDAGAWVTLANGNNTLGNADAPANDTERITVYVSLSFMQVSADTIEDDIVVIDETQTIPRRWYDNGWAPHLLAKLYEQIGITSLSFDAIEFQTYDASERLSFIDEPPAQDGIIGIDHRSIVADASGNLYLPRAGKVYKRDRLTGLYTLLTDVTTSVDRLLYNARNNHLWIFYGTTIKRYNLNTANLSSAITANAAADSMLLIDDNYTGSSYKYGIVWTEEPSGSNGGTLKYVDGSFADGGSPSVSTITTGTGLGYSGANGFRNKFAYAIATDQLRFRVFNNSAQEAYREYLIDGSGTFTDNGEKLAGIDDYTIATYSANEDRVYYWIVVSSAYIMIRSHTDASATSTDVENYGTAGLNTDGVIGSMYWSSIDNRTYWTVDETTGYNLRYTTSNATPTVAATGVLTQNDQITAANSRLYLVGTPNSNGINTLYQFSDQVVLNVPIARFTDMDVQSAINKVLSAFNLIAIVSSTKTAIVYRRGDSSGNPTTSGNTISISVDQATDIETVTGYVPKADLVQVNAYSVKTTYNGTSFDQTVLRDKYVVTLDNDFIPDAIAKDVAFYAYQFFKTQRDLYRIPCGKMPLFQYEPIDEATIAFTGTNIVKSASGPIYTTILAKDGSLDIEVLL